jgi:hypothetical protein
MAKRKQLAAPKAAHHRGMERAVKKIEENAARVLEKIRDGDCTTADTAYLRMHQAIGEFDAHKESGGSGKTIVWYPQRAVMDANGMMHDRCVRVTPQHMHDLEGHRRRRKR